MAIAPYIAPIASVPESPGNIFEGYLWKTKNAKQTDIKINVTNTMLLSPINKSVINNGIEVIITNPVDTPFNTSIVLIVFAVTGIDINTSNGYIIDNCTEPKNKKSKLGSYVPNKIIGTEANTKIKGFFLPPNDLKSSTNPIAEEITTTPSIANILISFVITNANASDDIRPIINAGPPGYATNFFPSL